MIYNNTKDLILAKNINIKIYYNKKRELKITLVFI